MCNHIYKPKTIKIKDSNGKVVTIVVMKCTKCGDVDNLN